MIDLKKNEKVVIKNLNEFFRRHDYKKVGKSWSRDQGDFVHMFSIQKSQWGSQFYINVGIFIKGLKIVKNPKIEDCHLSMRLERFMELSQEDFLSLFSFNLDNKRLLSNLNKITQTIELRVFFVLEKLSDFEYLSHSKVNYEGFWLTWIKKEDLINFALKELKK